MSLDLTKIKNKLNKLNNSKTSNNIWKPSAGKQVVRIVPYKYTPEFPFIELKFHYNVNGKTYLSPDTFGRPDPIVEFAEKLKSTGDKEDWKMGRSLEPKMRTFACVIVRGEEDQGVKFWGFGKQVYEELLSVLADPDYGDITDLTSGKDVVVDFKSAEESGKNYPTTSIRVKPNSTPAVDVANKKLVEMIKNQPNIMEMFTEHSYDELKEIADKWLNPETPDENTSGSQYNEGTTQTVSEVDDSEIPFDVDVKPKNESKTDKSQLDLNKSFDDLFSQGD
jgi:hypothetical protein